jgi:hypothetical protein
MVRKKKRRGKPPQRSHEVRATLENFTLAKAKSALRLEIFYGKEKLGELQVGKGSLYWWGAHRTNFKRVHWQKFAEMMDRLAYGKKE